MKRTVVLAVAAVALVVLPLAGLLQRAPWSTLATELASTEARQARALSLVTSLGALGVCVVLGVPLAWVLARVEFPGRALVRALVMLPMVLPPVVGGVACSPPSAGVGCCAAISDRCPASRCRSRSGR